MNNIKEQRLNDNRKGKKADFGPIPGGGTGQKVDFGPKPDGKPNFGPVPGGGSGGGVNFGPVPGKVNFGPVPGTGNPPATANLFDCVLKYSTNNKLSADKKSVNYTASNGDSWTWNLDYTFTYKYKDGTIDKGTWECNGTQDYKIKLENGDSYDSKTDKWTEAATNKNAGSSSSSSPSKPKLTDTSLTLDDLKAGKEVSKGMRGPVVGEIQKLLIAAGFKNISKSGNVDNIFGSRTKASVEQFQEKNTLKVDGIVGDETIKALISAPPASSSSSSSEDPNRKPFDPNAEKDNSIPSTDGTLIEKKKVLQESLKKMLRKSLLKYS